MRAHGDIDNKYTKSNSILSVKRIFSEISETLPPGLTIGRIVTIFLLGVLVLFLLMQIIHIIEGKGAKEP
jgi:hypothetical protein